MRIDNNPKFPQIYKGKLNLGMRFAVSHDWDEYALFADMMNKLFRESSIGYLRDDKPVWVKSQEELRNVPDKTTVIIVGDLKDEVCKGVHIVMNCVPGTPLMSIAIITDNDDIRIPGGIEERLYNMCSVAEVRMHEVIGVWYYKTHKNEIDI